LQQFDRDAEATAARELIEETGGILASCKAIIYDRLRNHLDV
jgi:8-oxo-dGTP pyrophosphatase MutT (NUDIX family)